jgi:hypothetical protein
VTSLILLLTDQLTFMGVNILQAQKRFQPLTRQAFDLVGFLYRRSNHGLEKASS